MRSNEFRSSESLQQLKIHIFFLTEITSAKFETIFRNQIYLECFDFDTKNSHQANDPVQKLYAIILSASRFPHNLDLFLLTTYRHGESKLVESR